MTSHYLRCNVRNRFENVFQALSAEFGNIYAREFRKQGESLKGVILGERYFFRVENDTALLVTVEQASDNETRAEIIACAAGAGLMGVSYGARATATCTVSKIFW